MKRLFMIFTVFAALITGLSSQELSDNNQEENQITAVSVSGLKKTKPYIIENQLRKFIGRDAGTIDTNEIFAIVKSTNVLEPLSVEITDGQAGSGKTLVVTVRDKWSIFPIPFGGISSSGWSIGGVLIDANVFGVKDTAMFMGLFGPGDITTSLMYIHSPKSVGEFGWNFMGFFSRQENENTDQTGKQILRRYNSMSIHPLVGLSYSLSEHITPSFSLAYRYVTLRDTENPINAPENGVQGITLAPDIRIGFGNIWDGYFLNERNISLKYDYTFVIGDDDVHSVTVNANFNHLFIPGFRFTARSGMVFSTSSASPFFEYQPTSAAVNILPTSYSAPSIAGVSLGLEKYLFKFSHGTLSLSAAYQAVYSYGELLNRQFDHGPAAMLLIYFSKLALPGIGLGGAYNVDKNTWQYAFNAGIQF